MDGIKAVIAGRGMSLHDTPEAAEASWQVPSVMDTVPRAGGPTYSNGGEVPEYVSYPDPEREYQLLCEGKCNHHNVPLTDAHGYAEVRYTTHLFCGAVQRGTMTVLRFACLTCGHRRVWGTRR